MRDVIVRQFRRPEGVLGRIAGWVMATRPSNRRRNEWTVALLDLRPHDRVLEVGCGPGLALALAARAVPAGHVVGLDHSDVMLAQAARRNRDAIARGQVRLEPGDLRRLPELGGPFDRIFSLNVVQFLPDKAAAVAALQRELRVGGILATTYQPRHRRPTRADALRMADEIRACMEAAGFIAIRIEELPMQPVPAVCVLGRRAE